MGFEGETRGAPDAGLLGRGRGRPGRPGRWALALARRASAPARIGRFVGRGNATGAARGRCATATASAASAWGGSGEAEAARDDDLHLPLVGAAGAGDGLLDLLRRVLGDVEPRARPSDRERDAARLAEDRARCGRCLMLEDALDGGATSGDVLADERRRGGPSSTAEARSARGADSRPARRRRCRRRPRRPPIEIDDDPSHRGASRDRHRARIRGDGARRRHWARGADRWFMPLPGRPEGRRVARRATATFKAGLGRSRRS
jgi:hypothetical protein